MIEYRSHLLLRITLYENCKCSRNILAKAHLTAKNMAPLQSFSQQQYKYIFNIWHFHLQQHLIVLCKPISHLIQHIPNKPATNFTTRSCSHGIFT